MAYINWMATVSPPSWLSGVTSAASFRWISLTFPLPSAVRRWATRSSQLALGGAQGTTSYGVMEWLSCGYGTPSG